MQLSDGWTLWPVALLRGAGLPFSLLERALGSEASAIELAREPALREAVAWQNRRMLVHGLERLVPGSVPDKQARQALRVLMRYVQRYAAKNDTIGFFGPLGWVHLRPTGEGTHEPASALVAARQVSFEPWAVKAILASCPQAVSRAPLRLAAHLRLDGRRLIGPEHDRPLSVAEVDLIRVADGRTRAAALLASGVAPEVCDRLIEQGVLQAHPPVAVAADPAVGSPPSPLLTHFRAHLAALARAVGDADAVAGAMVALERDFESCTGRSATRNHGQAYGGRTLVYEDCRRGGALALGPSTIEPLNGVLALLGLLARAYTFRIARHLCAGMLATFRGLGRRRVPLPRFWRLTDPLFEAARPEAVATAADALAQDWAAAFGQASEISLARARAALLPAWRVPTPGWPGARHHSPDVMWQAPDAQALIGGHGQAVIAELHPGVSTFTTLSVLGLCPVRTELESLWHEDFPDPLVSPIPHEDFARSTQDARLARRHHHIDTGHGYRSAHPGAVVLRAADLDVFEAEGRLWAGTPDHRHCFDLMAVFERRIKLRAAVAFPLAPTGPGPRLLVDGIVLRRATWCSVPPPLPRDRFRAPVRTLLRAWLAGLGAPQRVFARIEGEVKPVLVDARSDLSLDMFAAMLDGSAVSLSEMLPDGNGLWLADAQGERYTSELRCTLCDPVAYDGALVWQA